MQQPSIFLLLCFTLLFAASSPEPHPIPNFRPNKDHAILFAVNTYKAPLTNLTNPITNARQIATELQNRYGFKPQVVENPTSAQIEAILREYTNRFAKNLNGEYPSSGQLFIFFSGHGTEQLENGFFLPADADLNNLRQTAFQYSYLRPLINAVNCQHILVAVDACYSVTFDENYKKKNDFVFNRPGELSDNDKILANHEKYKSRMFFTSDAVGDMTPDKSNFAKKLLEGLRTFNAQSGFMTSSELFANYLQKASPTPHGGEFGADEAGSNFLFFLNQPKTNSSSNFDEIDRALEPSLIDAEQYINDLNYESAWTVLKSIKNLKRHQKEIAKLLLEIAFWNAEAGKYQKAVEILKAIAGPSLLNNEPILDSLQITANFEPFHLRRLIRALDEVQFQQLLNRYYPTMVKIKGGRFSVGNILGDNAIKTLKTSKSLVNSYSARIDSSGLKDTIYNFSIYDFELAKTETTIWQWSIFCASTGKTVNQYVPSNSPFLGNLPVSKVTWHEAVEYANWLSGRWPLNAPIAPFFKINGSEVDTTYKSKGFRLPTEEEWEYAAREGGKKIRYGDGSNIADPKKINFDCSRAETHALTGDFKGRVSPVGSFEPNKLGLHDMSGNLREWCLSYKPASRNLPPGPEFGAVGRSRYWCYVRGGAWNLTALHANVSLRYFGLLSNLKLDNIGFRVARSL